MIKEILEKMENDIYFYGFIYWSRGGLINYSYSLDEKRKINFESFNIDDFIETFESFIPANAYSEYGEDFEKMLKSKKINILEMEDSVIGFGPVNQKKKIQKMVKDKEKEIEVYYGSW